MRSSGTTFSKRQRERAKREKKREKAQKRAERKVDKDDPEATASASASDDVDPDIAHIVPGPQPIPEDELAERAAVVAQLEEQQAGLEE